METQENSIPLRAAGVLQEIHQPTEWKRSINFEEPPHTHKQKLRISKIYCKEHTGQVLISRNVPLFHLTMSCPERTSTQLISK